MSSSVFSLSPSPSPSSSTSTSSDNSEEDYDISFNKRLSPSWETYRSLFEQLGYHLDTACDVRLYYEQHFPGGVIPDSPEAVCQRKAYKRACEMRDDELCRDEGLVSDFCPCFVLSLISIWSGMNAWIQWCGFSVASSALRCSHPIRLFSRTYFNRGCLSIAWDTFPRHLQAEKQAYCCESYWIM